MKFIKYLKYLLIIFLSISVLIILGGIIKYNIDLNNYINQATPEVSANNNNSSSQGTEVSIVGSVHFETTGIKRDDLYRYLDSISPTVILYESVDAKDVKRMVNRTDFFYQLQNTLKNSPKVESFVTLKYVVNHSGTEVFHYDWEERNAYHFKHNYRATSSKMLRAVLKLYRENQLTDEESAIIKEYLNLNKELQGIGRQGSVNDLNSLRTDSIIRNRQWYVYKNIPEIIKNRKDLEEFKDFAGVHMEYWDIRNKAMVENILNQIKRNPNKKIVVLNGFYHRYYLVDELKKYESEFNFSVN